MRRLSQAGHLVAARVRLQACCGQGLELISRTVLKSQTTVLLSGTKLCFDFVAVTSQWQSASDEDWALALAREAVIGSLDHPT